jgi:YidC/Oxa1 family membrane protein insertase
MPTTMDKTQRYILLALPIVFLFFVANFPAGLVIYWVTTNLWTVGQGLVTRGLRKPPPPPPKRSSRTPPASETRKQQDGKPAPAAAGQPSRPRRVKKKKKRAGR